MEKVISKLSNEELDLVVGGTNEETGKGFFTSMPAGMASTFKHNSEWKFGTNKNDLSKAGFYAGKYLVLMCLTAISAVSSAGITYLCTKKKANKEK